MSKGKYFNFRLIPYDISRVVVNCFNVGYRMKRVHVSGRRYKEKLRGGAILAMNHTGFGDPFVTSVCFWYRRVFFLAAETVMQGKLRTLLLKGTGCIRIDRNISDLEAVKKCVQLLRDGRMLTVFPQGGLTDGEEDVKVKSGAVLMALQAGVPIVPMYSLKREHWYERKVVVVADPIDCRDYITKKIPSMKDIERVSHALRESMEQCKEVCERMKKK